MSKGFRWVFDCNFTSACWNTMVLAYDPREVFSAPDWLLQKLGTTTNDEATNIAIVL